MMNKLFKHIENTIAAFEKYNINNGGCGMVAIQVVRFLKIFGFPEARIRANFANSEHGWGFQSAEHYSIVVKENDREYEINPPKFKPVFWKDEELKIAEQSKIYFLENNCSYDHSNDLDFFNSLWGKSNEKD